MEESKKWYTSKTEVAAIVGFIAVALINILPMIGVDTIAAGEAVQKDSVVIVEQILGVTSGLAFIVAFIGRFIAKKQLTA